MAHYTIKAWSNDGPLRLSEPLIRNAALRKARELRERGFTHISLIDPETGSETDLDEFLNPEKDGFGG